MQLTAIDEKITPFAANCKWEMFLTAECGGEHWRSTQSPGCRVGTSEDCVATRLTTNAKSQPEGIRHARKLLRTSS